MTADPAPAVTAAAQPPASVVEPSATTAATRTGGDDCRAKGCAAAEKCERVNSGAAAGSFVCVLDAVAGEEACLACDYWSCFTLADAYKTGRGVAKDLSKARALLARGCSEACGANLSRVARSRCATEQVTGPACKTFKDCPPNHYCSLQPITGGICMTRRKLGEPCPSKSDLQCETGLVCDDAFLEDHLCRRP